MTPVATGREWRLHRAHDMTVGQVLGRVVLLACADWLAAYVLIDMIAEVLSDPPSPGDAVWEEAGPSDWTQIVAVSLGVTAVLGVLYFALARASHAVATAAGVALVRVSGSTRTAVLAGLTRAARHPMPPDEAVTLLGGAFIGAVALSASVACSASLMCEVSWVLRPLVAVACATGLVVLAAQIFRTLSSVQDLSQAAGSLWPRLRSARVRVPVEQPCVVCSGERLDRGRVRWAFRRICSTGRLFLSRMADRSAFMAVAANHPGLWTAAVLAWGWLSLLHLSGADLATVTLMSSCLLALLVMGATFYGAAPSFFDTVMALPSWRRLLAMSGAYACGMALLSNARLVETAVQDAAGPVRGAFGGYDSNFSMLFVLTTEACVLFAAGATVASWLGHSPVWSARECIARSFLPWVGLGIGAVEGGWYPTVLLAFVTWAVARSRIEREDWSEKRQAAGRRGDRQRGDE